MFRRFAVAMALAAATLLDVSAAAAEEAQAAVRVSAVVEGRCEIVSSGAGARGEQTTAPQVRCVNTADQTLSVQRPTAFEPAMEITPVSGQAQTIVTLYF